VSATNIEVRTDQKAQCAAASEAGALIRDNWTILVLGALRRHRTLRYSELERAVGGISQRMLTLTPKRLEENGLVARTAFASGPPRVDHALTPMGRTLIAPLRGLLSWSAEHRAAMETARRGYAKRTA